MMLRRVFLKPLVQHRGCFPSFCTTGAKKEIPSIPSSPRPRTVLLEADVEEKFSRGSGPGGQSVNKSRNKVQLVHVPTGLTVSCHEQRDLTTNRSIARKILKDKLDLLLHGEESKLGKRVVRIQKRKSKSASRARKKYETKGSGDQDEPDKQDTI